MEWVTIPIKLERTLAQLVQLVPFRLLVKPLFSCLDSVAEQGAPSVAILFRALETGVAAAPRPDISAHCNDLFSFSLKAFEALAAGTASKDALTAEGAVIKTAVCIEVPAMWFSF